MDAYQAYIDKCKAKKPQAKVIRIVRTILELLRQGMTTDQMVEALNKLGVLTIQDKTWNYYSLQMQLAKMARQDNDSSLAWAFSLLLDTDEANLDDLQLLKNRCRSVQ